MLKQLIAKLKESTLSVAPVALIVLILSFTPLVNLSLYETLIFVVCAILLIIGISLFSLGADIAMSPMGNHVGNSLTKTGKILLISGVCFLLGVLITVAEPDLSVLAKQIGDVIPSIGGISLLVPIVGVGVGVFLFLGILKIFFKKDLTLFLMFFYFLAFSLAALIAYTGKGNFLALSFDSGGVTTGPITVPFIMALGIGVASTVGGHNIKENSFGLISLCSVGPIISLLLIGLCVKDVTFTVNEADYMISSGSSLALDSLMTFLETAKDVAIALGLVVLFFMIIELIFIKLPKSTLLNMLIGIGLTFGGLVIFLSAATVGFLPVGFSIGKQLTANTPLLVIFGFVIGCVVVLAEPAVQVLTKQVEEVTTGGVSKKSMLIALCIGVGISLCLSMIRIIFDFSILYFLIPGYLLSLGLSFFVPKIYTAIAFDSGGVASGPLTSSFLLPLAIGACCSLYGSDAPQMLADGFGIVAMVAMAPLITIQLLGFKAILKRKVTKKTRFKNLLSSDEDEQIINFLGE